MKVLVIGAGVVGLSTAVCIQEAYPQCHVTIMSERFPPEDIVSMTAGGIILVTPPQNPDELQRKVGLTCTHLSKLSDDGNYMIHGVQKKDGYYGMGTETFGEKLDDRLRPLSSYSLGKAILLTPEECESIMPTEPWSGWLVSSFCVDTRRYLPYLLHKFHSKGGLIERGKADTIPQVSSNYDVVVNCTGLGSRELTGDSSMYPVKGQLMRMETKGKVDKFLYIINLSEGRYYISHAYDTVVGGTYEPHVEDRSVNLSLSLRLERFARRHPGMKDGKILDEYTGLRPHRHGGIRIEKEHQIVHGKKITIIHNYGHGGYGVGTSWGSALQVCELLGQVVPTSSKL